MRRAARLIASVKTNCGQFQIKLDAKRAPTIVTSFVYLARAGYYYGLALTRVVPNFVIQGGDAAGHGIGVPGYSYRTATLDHRYRLAAS